MKIDLHDHSLEEAKEELCYSLDECKQTGDSTLEIVHGYKHGTAIRDYIRSNRFINEINKLGHKITSKNISDEGSTVFYLKLPTTKSGKSQTKKIHRKKTYVCLKCNQTMVRVEGLNWVKCPTCGRFVKL